MEYAHAQGLSFPGELEHGIERWIVTFRTAGPLKIDSFFFLLSTVCTLVSRHLHIIPVILLTIPALKYWSTIMMEDKLQSLAIIHSLSYDVVGNLCAENVSRKWCMSGKCRKTDLDF